MHIIPDAHNLTYKSYDVQYWNYVHTFSDGKTRDAVKTIISLAKMRNFIQRPLYVLPW